MDLFGPNMTFVERAGLVFVIFACIVLLLLFVRLIVKGRPFKLSIFGNEVDVKDPNVLNDAGKDALVDIFTMTLNTAATISFLKTKQILSDQMYYLEDKLILIQEGLTNSYRACLSATLKQLQDQSATVTSHKEYHFFTSLVTLMIEDMKRTCRQTFIKNNFSHYTEKEFSEYTEEKVTLLKAKALLFLRELYPSDKMIVPFESVETEVFNKEAGNIGDHLSHVFKKAVVIYKSRHEEAGRMDQELKDYIMATYGVDIDAPRKAAREARDEKDSTRSNY